MAPGGCGLGLPTAVLKGGVEKSVWPPWTRVAVNDSGSHSVSTRRPSRVSDQICDLWLGIPHFCLPGWCSPFPYVAKRKTGKDTFELNSLQRFVELCRERRRPK